MWYLFLILCAVSGLFVLVAFVFSQKRGEDAHAANRGTNYMYLHQPRVGSENRVVDRSLDSNVAVNYALLHDEFLEEEDSVEDFIDDEEEVDGDDNDFSEESEEYEEEFTQEELDYEYLQDEEEED